jgi:hypothetical protein
MKWSEQRSEMKWESASLLFVIFFVFLRSWLLDKIPSIDLLFETILPFLLINKRTELQYHSWLMIC